MTETQVQLNFESSSEVLRSRLERAFLEFHRQNPAVYQWFKEYAFALIHAGRQRLSASLITERIRYEVMLKTTDPEFKINNNHRAYYARLFMSDYPEYYGYFETRHVNGSAPGSLSSQPPTEELS